MKNLKFLILMIFIQTPHFALTQPNCEIFEKSSPCYQGCLEIYKADKHRQGSYVSQKHFDNAIENCPTLAYAYFEKSVAHVKRGYFPIWKKLIDKAIELEPKEYLFYRAWCQFTFLRNYEVAIIDLNRLKKLNKTPFLGVGQNGDYDLRVILALCYKMTGNKEKAIEILREAFSKKDFYPGLYDYLHLGVLYLETNQLDKAITSFEKQLVENEVSEVHFYLGMAHKLQGNFNNAKEELDKALHLYKNGRKMHSNYFTYVDQIYEEDIVKLANNIQ